MEELSHLRITSSIKKVKDDSGLTPSKLPLQDM